MRMTLTTLVAARENFAGGAHCGLHTELGQGLVGVNSLGAVDLGQ